MSRGSVCKVVSALLTSVCASLAIDWNGGVHAESGDDSQPDEEFSGLVDIGDGRELYLQCAGEGSPVILLEAGDESGVIEWHQMFSSLAAETRTCAYDRAGVGRSSPATGCRGLDEKLDDLEGLLDVAGLEPPYLLVGTSGGGYLMAGLAARRPDDVAGLVLLEAPAAIPVDNPPPEVPPEVIEELMEFADTVLACDAPTNIERRDYVAVEGAAWDARGPLGDFPMPIVSNDYGDVPLWEGGEKLVEQQGWLVLSSNAQQIVVTSGHSVVQNEPKLVETEILAVLTAARASNAGEEQTFGGRLRRHGVRPTPAGEAGLAVTLAAASGPAVHIVVDVTGSVIRCATTTYTITSGTIKFTFHEGTSRSGNLKFVDTITPQKVVAVDEAGNVYSVRGATSSAEVINVRRESESETLTGNLQIVAPGEGTVDTFNMRFHFNLVGNEIANFKAFDVGSCAEPE